MKDLTLKHMKIGAVLTNMGPFVYNITDFILLEAQIKFIESKKEESNSMLEGPLFLNPWKINLKNL